MKHLKRNVSFALLGFTLFLGACASASTTVEAPSSTKQAFQSIRIVYEDPNAEVPTDLEAKFAKALEEQLYKEGGFQKGGMLTLSYRFIGFEKGNRAKRYFIRLGAGKGTIITDVKFKDASGAVLSEIEVEGEIAGGLFGGSIDEAVTKAAKEIAEYTIVHFK